MRAPNIPSHRFCSTVGHSGENTIFSWPTPRPTSTRCRTTPIARRIDRNDDAEFLRTRGASLHRRRDGAIERNGMDPPPRTTRRGVFLTVGDPRQSREQGAGVFEERSPSHLHSSIPTYSALPSSQSTSIDEVEMRDSRWRQGRTRGT